MSRGTALWLLPPPEVRAQYASVIDELSERYGTARFEPHLTLVSGVPMDHSVEAAAHALQPLLREVEIHPLRVVVGDGYYRCIVIEVAARGALVAARREAERLLGLEQREFWPHVSVVYGELPVEAKRQIVAGLAKFPLQPFPAAALEAVDIHENPAAWRARLRLAL